MPCRRKEREEEIRSRHQQRREDRSGQQPDMRPSVHCEVIHQHEVKAGQQYLVIRPNQARKINCDHQRQAKFSEDIHSHNMKSGQDPQASRRSGEEARRRSGERREQRAAGLPAWLAVLAAALVSSTLLQGCQAKDTLKEMPHFLEPISNVTVPAGRDVRLACVVDHLGSYKLAWIQKDRSAILTVGNHVITRNNRIGVSHDGHRTWYLTIKNVRPGDAGTYMCQINTEVAISQTGHVSVVVPPYIKDDMSSGDVSLQERMDLTLACSARGSPVPTIKWRREDNHRIRANHSTSLLEVHGPLLRLNDLTRTDMGAYLCIAHNGIPPSVSKRIEVNVKFLPTVIVPHQLVGVPIGQNVTIECYIEAWPQGLNYWKRPNGIDVLHSDDKYEVQALPGSQKYKTHMLLTISSVSRADIGEYNCIANNSQGGAEQVIRVSASVPIQHNNRNSLDKGYDTKDNSYGKAPLSSVNWSKDNDGSSALKEEHEDLRKPPQRKYKNSQHTSITKILNHGLDLDLPLPPPSASASASTSPFFVSWRRSWWPLVGHLVCLSSSWVLLLSLPAASL